MDFENVFPSKYPGLFNTPSNGFPANHVFAVELDAVKNDAFESVIQNAVSVTIAVSVAIGKNRLNAEIAFHIAAKMRFGQLKTFPMWPFRR